MSIPTKEQWDAYLHDLFSIPEQATRYEWYVSPRIAREAEALGGMEQWLKATPEEREQAVADKHSCK